MSPSQPDSASPPHLTLWHWLGLLAALVAGVLCGGYLFGYW